MTTLRAYRLTTIDLHFSDKAAGFKWITIQHYDQLGIRRVKHYTNPSPASIQRLARLTRHPDDPRRWSKHLHADGWSLLVMDLL